MAGGTVSSERARRLAGALEPIAASVYFAREVHDAFRAVGFGPPTEAEGCLPLADLPSYYCSRAGCMGQVPGEVVVAAFGVFNPELIIPNVERGWATAPLGTVLQTRLEGQTAALQRVLGEQPGIGRATELLLRAGRAVDVGGRFLAAGLRSLPLPDEGWGRLWRAAREAIEVATDLQQRAVLDSLGDDYDELVGLLEPWSAALVAAGSYPSDIRQLPPGWGAAP